MQTQMSLEYREALKRMKSNAIIFVLFLKLEGFSHSMVHA